MNPIDPKTLLNMAEGETFDFKSLQYKFYGATDEEKAELLKDIIAFANAWKIGDAFIVIGVSEIGGRKEKLLGVTNALKDNDIQQFVNSKTNRPVKFLIYRERVEAVDVDIICIDKDQQRPIFLSKPFGKLQANAAYIRSGSTTIVASPDQIGEMVKADHTALLAQAVLDLEWIGFKNQRIGKTATVTCIELTDPPPPSPKPRELPEPPRETRLPFGSLGIFKPMGESVATATFAVHHGPSSEERIAYAKARASFGALRIWVKNLGIRNASSITVKIRIRHAPDVAIIDRRGLPRKPSSLADSLVEINRRTPVMDTFVDNGRDDWNLSLAVGTLQPQQEFCSCDEFYVSAKTSQTLNATATIFADDLAPPIEIPLTINVDVRKRQIEPADFSEKP